MRPDDLLGRRHEPCGLRVGPVHDRPRADGGPEFAPAGGEDAAAPPDLLFFGRERHRLVRFSLRDVRQPPGFRIERELVAVARVRDGVRALRDVQPEVERVSAEDVAHVVAADDDQLEPRLFGDTFQPRRAHLAGGSDGEAIAGDEERLAAVHARPEVGHEVPERPRLPSLVERVETLRDAVGGGRDLIRVDRVELLRRGALAVPEDERFAADEMSRAAASGLTPRACRVVHGCAGLQAGGLDSMRGHLWSC